MTTSRARSSDVSKDQNPSHLRPVISESPPARRVNVLLVSLFALVSSLLVAVILTLGAAAYGATPYQLRLLTAASLFIFALGMIGTYARGSKNTIVLEHEELGLLFTLGMLLVALCLTVTVGEVKWPKQGDDQVDVSSSKSVSNILSSSFCNAYHCSEEAPRKLEAGQTRHMVDLNVQDVHLSYVTDQNGNIKGYSIEFPGEKKSLSSKDSEVLQKFLQSAIPLGAPITFGYGARQNTK